MLVVSGLLAATGTAVGVAEDLQRGVTDRFRSLPMNRFAVLAGRTMADLFRNGVSALVMIAVSFAIGFRFHTSAARTVAAIAIALAFAYAISWVFCAVALLVKDPEAATFLGFGPPLLLVFVSSAFVPTATMPGWLQGFAKLQPVTVVTNAVRPLMIGGPTDHVVIGAVAWITGLLLVFVPLAARQYQRVSV
jgi:ABC-2 type transport system permease protein/oleandomycin transport system permease protein